MLLDWYRQLRRRRILKDAFPESWEAILKNTVPQSRYLDAESATKLRRLMQVFVAEKNWEGCNGLVLTEKMQVVIAAYASLIVLGFHHDEYYENVKSILIYPAGFSGKHVDVIGTGLVLESAQQRIGEAWYRGPVVVSWSDILKELRDDDSGRNVIIHEFAHQLDMLNGRHADGMPPLQSEEQRLRWNQVMTEEFDELVEECRIYEETFLDCYGATSPAEFFAVASESFFEAPRAMRHYHPQLYSILSEYYLQNPAGWAVVHREENVDS